MAEQDTNFLSPIGFALGIVKLPGIGFKTQRVNLPGISLPNTQQNTPFTDAPVPGDKMTWEPFTIDFMIDETMANYMSIWQWMIGLGFPNDYAEFIDGANRPLVHMSDGFLQILGSNNVLIKTIKFHDMFPTSLNAITFQSTDSDVNYIQGTATFEYTTFKFE